LTRDQDFDLEFFFFRVSPKKKNEENRKRRGKESPKAGAHALKYRRMKFKVALSVEDPGLVGTVNLPK